MPGKQRIELYCLCWNDARMLPFFFQHYDDLVEKYFVFDNGSTDESIPLLKNHGRVEITHFDTPGDSFVEEERRLGDTMWRNSDADWVIVTDIDEHVYHPRLRAYLQQRTDEGITAIQSIGYEMISDNFPAEGETLVEQVTLGVRSTGCDRLCIFNPKALTETNFTVGRHEAEPKGRVVWPEFPEVLLLHYKQLGLEYLISRSAELGKGLRPRDLEQSWGVHYTWNADQITEKFHEIKDASTPVPGLGELKHIEPAEYFADDRMVAQSGLFDGRWYLAAYTDVAAAGVNPFSHYCLHGWREGRQPNFYFEPDWYRANQAPQFSSWRNPLCDYVQRGEKQNAAPSPLFDTTWYRAQHGLAPQESPLRHYLTHRMSGLVSPRSDFDVARYCHDHPDTLSEGKDPFEDYCRSTATTAARKRSKETSRSRAKRGK